MINIDHKEYPKSLKNKSDETLKYIIKDAKEAIAANPEGDKAGYYQDEVHYCVAELNSRKPSEVKRETFVNGTYESTEFMVGNTKVQLIIDEGRKQISWPSYGAVNIDIAEDMYKALGEAIKVAKEKKTPVSQDVIAKALKAAYK